VECFDGAIAETLLDQPLARTLDVARPAEDIEPGRTIMPLSCRLPDVVN